MKMDLQRLGLNPEPSPNLDAASESWHTACKTHWITFTFVFTFLGIYGIFSLIKSRKRTQKIARHLCYTVYSLLILFTVTRTVFLLMFPQELNADEVNKALQVSTRVIFRLGFPCLTASFALIDISFVDAVRGKISNSRLRSLKFLVIVVAVHFAVDLISAGLTSFVENTFALYLLCVSYFIVVVIVILIRITISGRNILIEYKSHQIALHGIAANSKASSANGEQILGFGRKTVGAASQGAFPTEKGRHQDQVFSSPTNLQSGFPAGKHSTQSDQQNVDAENHGTSFANGRNSTPQELTVDPEHHGAAYKSGANIAPERHSVNRAVSKVRNVIILTWISALMTIAVSILSLFSMGMVLSGDSLLQEPWSWYIHQTFFRLAEVLMVVTILYSLKPTRAMEKSRVPTLFSVLKYANYSFGNRKNTNG